MIRDLTKCNATVKPLFISVFSLRHLPIRLRGIGLKRAIVDARAREWRACLQVQRNEAIV